MLGPGPQAPPQVQSHIATSQHQTSQLPQPTTPRGGGGGRDNWYRDDWFSRQDNTWQHDTHRDSYQVTCSLISQGGTPPIFESIDTIKDSVLETPCIVQKQLTFILVMENFH